MKTILQNDDNNVQTLRMFTVNTSNFIVSKFYDPTPRLYFRKHLFKIF